MVGNESNRNCSDEIVTNRETYTSSSIVLPATSNNNLSEKKTHIGNTSTPVDLTVHDYENSQQNAKM